MPSKKKKYNARFPAGRIKKIMQTDEEVGKVAQAVPVIISRTLELFVESLLTKSMQITLARNAKTLTPSHMKQCILSESRFDFLKDLVKNVPDASTQEDNEMAQNDCAELAQAVLANPNDVDEEQRTAFKPNFYTEQGSSRSPSVIQYGPKARPELARLDVTVQKSGVDGPKTPQTPRQQRQQENRNASAGSSSSSSTSEVPPLISIAHNNLYGHQVNSDNLCIDEDYDN